MTHRRQAAPHGAHGRWRARSHWWRARRGARAGRWRSNWARPGATVYVTGRTTREQVSEVGPGHRDHRGDRGTGHRGGRRRASPCPPTTWSRSRCGRWSARIDREQGRLDVLVNDIWGGEHLVEFGQEDVGAPTSTAGCGCCGSASTPTSSPAATRCRCWSGAPRRPGRRGHRRHGGVQPAATASTFFYDLAKNAPIRMACGLAEELRSVGGTAVALTPGLSPLGGRCSTTSG